MISTEKQLAPWHERNPEIHAGTPDCYRAWLSGINVVRMTANGALIERFDDPKSQVWVSRRLVAHLPERAIAARVSHDVCVPVWLYHKLRDELK